MTTPRRAPVLDRLIVRTGLEQGPPITTSVVYRLDTEAALVDEAGEWFFASNRLSFYLQDADGVALPALGSLTIGTQMVTIVSGGYTVTTGITNYDEARNPFNSPLSGTGRLTFPSGAVDGNQLSGVVTLGFGGIISITPAPVETEIRMWAARRDFAAADFVQSTSAGLVTIKDSRYIVRQESWPDVDELDTFQDDGSTWTIQGVGQIGRRYLELLARRTG